MDHDMMSIPRDRFDPAELVRGSSRDGAYIHGEPGEGRCSDFEWFTSVYRLDEATIARGRAALIRSAAGAARRAREALAEDARVRSEFEPRVLAAAADWDTALAEFLRSRSVDAAAALLRGRGQDDETVRDWTDVMSKHRPFLEQHSALFGLEADW
jgi:hypothetical protein